MYNLLYTKSALIQNVTTNLMAKLVALCHIAHTQLDRKSMFVSWLLTVQMGN